jgi:hypothetical protein
VSPEWPQISPRLLAVLRLHQNLGGEAQEEGAPWEAGSLPTLVRCPQWSEASQQSAPSWKCPTTREASARGVRRFTSEESKRGCMSDAFTSGGSSSPDVDGRCSALRPSPKGVHKTRAASDGRTRPEMRQRGRSSVGFTQRWKTPLPLQRGEGNEEDDTVVRAFIARASGWGRVVSTLTYNPAGDVMTACVRRWHAWAQDEALSDEPGAPL